MTSICALSMEIDDKRIAKPNTTSDVGLLVALKLVKTCLLQFDCYSVGFAKKFYPYGMFLDRLSTNFVNHSKIQVRCNYIYFK